MRRQVPKLKAHRAQVVLGPRQLRDGARIAGTAERLDDSGGLPGVGAADVESVEQGVDGFLVLHAPESRREANAILGFARLEIGEDRLLAFLRARGDGAQRREDGEDGEEVAFHQPRIPALDRLVQASMTGWGATLHDLRLSILEATLRDMLNSLNQVDHFVVLMLENHSFDQMLGHSGIAGIDGLVEGRLYNQVVDTAGTLVGMPVRKDAPFSMTHDPGHEFMDVRNQLWGPQVDLGSTENVGFVYSYAKSADISIEEAKIIMSAFTPERLPVLTTLAKEFAVFDRWFSSMPGPTWPNRFFVHAATSGGLIASPDPTKIAGEFEISYERACVDGFDFRGGTIYDALQRQKKKWRIYHGDHWPQTSILRGMIPRLLSCDGFREMTDFAADVASGDLPDYTFIEPNYGNTQNFTGGNSQHPVGDIREGERLIKSVYEAIRASKLWPKTALVILYDEHGGFFDHVQPPVTVPTGNDDIFNGSPVEFEFQQLGMRVPAVVISPLIPRGVVDHTTRDHAALIATVGERFGLDRLTKRDKNALSFETVFSLSSPREDTPTMLPEPPVDASQPTSPPPQAADGPVDSMVKSALHLARAIDIKLDGSRTAMIDERLKAITTKAQASAYISEVEGRFKLVRAQRR